MDPSLVGLSDLEMWMGMIEKTREGEIRWIFIPHLSVCACQNPLVLTSMNSAHSKRCGSRRHVNSPRLPDTNHTSTIQDLVMVFIFD
jgi:hypothetical protein